MKAEFFVSGVLALKDNVDENGEEEGVEIGHDDEAN